MTSLKPRSVWQWLVFLSPAVAMVICGTALPPWINAAYQRTGEETIGTAMECGQHGFLASSLLSLGLGFWVTRGETSRSRRIKSAM